MVKPILIFLILTAAAAAQVQEPPVERSPSNFALGATVGSPAGISAVGAFYSEHISLRVSGGAWGKDWYGLQAECSLVLFRGEEFSHGISLLAGRFGTRTYIDPEQGYDSRTQNYIGLAYDMNLGGFFLEAGLGFGPGTAPGFPNPVGLFQAGYLFRL